MSPDQKEDLRHATLEILVACHPVARPMPAIRRNVARELTFSFTDDDLDSALTILTDLGLVAATTDDLGSSKWFHATPAAVLKLERRQ